MTTCRAALDLGSNLIRVAVGTRLVCGNTQVIHKAVRVARIAQGLGGAGGVIEPGPMQRAIDAMCELRDISVSYGCHISSAVATGALRLAANRSEVIDAIRTRSGVDVQIIDGEREAKLSLRGVVSQRGDSGGGGSGGFPIGADATVAGAEVTLVDIGGTTTEVVRARVPAGGTPPVTERFAEPFAEPFAEEVRSFDIGVITLAEWGQRRRADDRALKAHAARVFDGITRSRAGAPCFAAGGAAVALSAWRREEPFLTYMGRPDEVLTGPERIAIYREFLAATPAERGRRLQVSEEHAALVPAGYAILDALTEALGVVDVSPTGRGVVEGLLDEVLAADR